MSIRVTGPGGRQLTLDDAIRQIVRRSVERAEQAIDATKDADKDAAIAYERLLERESPVDTGALKKSIAVITRRKGKGLKTAITLHPYGKYYGNFVQQGRWIERARQRAMREVPDLYNEAFQQRMSNE